jgi:hypothetical protein
MKLALHPISDAAIDYVLEHLSAEDAAELAAAGPHDWHQHFRDAAAHALTAGTITTAAGTPIAVYGLTPHVSAEGVAIPWMMGTDGVIEHARDFAAISLAVVDEMRQCAAVLINAVHARHTRAVRWLEWLGFHVKHSERVGPGNEFIPFEMRCHV